MRPGRISLWPIAVIGALALVCAVSITPTVRLKPDAPADFAALRVSDRGPNSALAQGYWETAVEVLQWKYPRTSALPVEVPEEFKLAADAPQAGKQETGPERGLYWAKLREEWLIADNWQTSYRFDISWLTGGISELARGLVDFFRGRGAI